MSGFSQFVGRLYRRADRLYMSKGFAWALIGMGIILRLAQYWANRSLWLDEAFVALDAINLSFPELLQPSLHASLTSPLGFLVIEKLAVQAFGSSEFALRLFPLLSGIAVLFLFYGTAKRYLAPRAVPIALGLLAVSDMLIYYSSEAKQYSSDVAVGLLLCFLAIRVWEKGLTVPRVLLWGVLGAIVVWISNPALFVLAGIGGSLILWCIVRRQWAKIGWLVVACLLWASSFLVHYSIYLHYFTEHATLVEYWEGSYLPLPPMSLSDVTALVWNFFAIFERPGGGTLPGIGALAFLVGCITFMRSKKREILAILLAPVLVIAVASGLGKYPFRGRLLLFIVPALVLLMAEGAQQIIDQTKPKGAWIGILFIALLFYHPLYGASYYLMHPRTKQEIKPVLSYLKEHKQDSDVLYVYYVSDYAFRYYADRYGLDDSSYVGRAEVQGWADLAADVNQFAGSRRVWLLFSGVSETQEQLFVAYLDSVGTQLDSFQRVGASAYLYDLGAKPVPPECSGARIRISTSPCGA